MTAINTRALDRELKRGSAELLILSLLDARPRHGYELSKLIHTRSGGQLTFHIDSLYPLLYRLEERGWIKGTWVEKPDERRRRFNGFGVGHTTLPCMSTSWVPMPLLRASQPFDHPDWIFELKHDGFRALAIIEGHHCRLVSRQAHQFWQWPQLAEELAHAVRVERAALDGEIVCLRRDGNSDFYSLMFRREWPYFYAFDVLSLEGQDLRAHPLKARKRRLAAIMPRIESRVRYVDHVSGRGRDLFRLVCERDAEGIVAKWARGRYHSDDATTSWLKVKNPEYSQAVGRHEFFSERPSASRRPMATRRLDPRALAAARACSVAPLSTSR